MCRYETRYEKERSKRIALRIIISIVIIPIIIWGLVTFVTLDPLAAFSTSEARFGFILFCMILMIPTSAIAIEKG